MRCRRLRFLAQLHTASPMLRALLQEGGVRIPWVQAIVGKSGGLASSSAEGVGDASPSRIC